MKLLAKICISFILLIVICSCRATMQTTTSAHDLSGHSFPKINIKHPVAIKNTSSIAGNIILCEPIGWKVLGDLYKYTDTSIDIVKDIFKRQDIIIEDKSDKILEFAVDKAKCWDGAIPDKVTITLKVKTGDGLEKEYESTRGYKNGYATTVAIEEAMVDCVKQMLYDKEILRYLEN